MCSEVAETDEMQQYQERWRLEQDTLKQQLIEDDVHDWDLSKNQESQLKVLCGVDISFVKDTDEACACVVFMSFPELEVIHTEMQLVTMQLPYIAGFLAFREVNFLVELYQKAVAATGIEADVILADGNGILHHRGFGIASHLGVLLGVPTIGVAKKLLAVDGLDSDTVKALTQTPEADELISHNSFVAKDIVGESGRVWGSVVRPTAGTKNPVYVSVGHRVSLETAVEVVRCTSKFRVPEPVRQADLLSRQFLRDLDAAS